MTKSEPATGYKSFLIVDEFLSSFIGTRALKTAFELGLIDRLAARKSGSVDALARAIGIDPPGAALLFGLLRANGVIQTGRGNVRFTARFEDAQVEGREMRELLVTLLDHERGQVLGEDGRVADAVEDEQGLARALPFGEFAKARRTQYRALRDRDDAAMVDGACDFFQFRRGNLAVNAALLG